MKSVNRSAKTWTKLDHLLSPQSRDQPIWVRSLNWRHLLKIFYCHYSNAFIVHFITPYIKATSIVIPKHIFVTAFHHNYFYDYFPRNHATWTFGWGIKPFYNSYSSKSLLCFLDSCTPGSKLFSVDNCSEHISPQDSISAQGRPRAKIKQKLWVRGGSTAGHHGSTVQRAGQSVASRTSSPQKGSVFTVTG